MPNCEDRHSIDLDAISNDIAAVAKVDEPFSKLFGKVIDHPTEAVLRTEYLHALPDRFTGPMRGICALGAQKLTQPLQVPDRRRGEHHL